MPIDFSNARKGIFIRERSNRFRCQIQIDNEEETCYVASSSRLTDLIPLEGATVLVEPNCGKTTKYTLVAKLEKNDLILLNLSMVNDIVAENLYRKTFSFLETRATYKRETLVGGYKADIFLNKSNTIIEIKTVLTNNDCGFFPTTPSKRSIEQLKKLQLLMLEGYKVCYFFICLNPNTKAVIIKDESDFYKELTTCVELGMSLKAFTLHMNQNDNIRFYKAKLTYSK